MARGNSRAQSEAGTITRAETQARRIKDAAEVLRGNSFSTKASDAADILSKPRANSERYNVELGNLAKGGKLNMMDGTIDGKELSRDTRGAFDKTSVKRRGSPESDQDFNYEASKSQRQEGFVFAKDDKGELFAIPHTWNVNDPQGTVGVFKGDTLTYSDAKGEKKEVTVIGTFDNSKRGLNLAAAAAGDALNRPMGVKQTATVLGLKDVGDRLTNQTRVAGTSNSYVYREVIDGQVVSDLNEGVLSSKNSVRRI